MVRAVNLALFDFDGTLTWKDSFTAFIVRTAGTSRLLAGTLRLAPLIARHYLGHAPGPQLRAGMVRHAFAGRRFDEVRDLGERFAACVLPGMIRPRALERLHWHQHRGDRVVVVSASLSFYLAPWCQQQQTDLLCSDLEQRDGFLTGVYAGEDCAGAEKARRVCESYPLESYQDIYAYGDSGEDAALLGLANRPFFRWSAFD